QYSVTVTSGQPVSVVLNTHNDDPGVAQPVFYSANGISTGAATVYGAYAVKNANGSRVSTIVVQNLSAGPLTPSLSFTPLTSAGTRTVNLTPGVSVKIDPNISVPQGAQYAVTVTANGNVAAIVMELNASGGDNAMIYGGFPAP